MNEQNNEEIKLTHEEIEVAQKLLRQAYRHSDGTWTDQARKDWLDWVMPQPFRREYEAFLEASPDENERLVRMSEADLKDLPLDPALEAAFAKVQDEMAAPQTLLPEDWEVQARRLLQFGEAAEARPRELQVRGSSAPARSGFSPSSAILEALTGSVDSGLSVGQALAASAEVRETLIRDLALPRDGSGRVKPWFTAEMEVFDRALSLLSQAASLSGEVLISNARNGGISALENLKQGLVAARESLQTGSQTVVPGLDPALLTSHLAPVVNELDRLKRVVVRLQSRIEEEL
ncbi:MAG: hypothetical protein MH204_05810 [Fimbriimonadaceae bacterium]|nr:hypothetical protein [Fimbriimonadaceae bacterium]